jgi:hypothetical protein
MYFGHFAVAAAIKAKEPKIPAAPILIGVGVLDIVDGIFIMLGIDRVTPNLASLPYLFFDLSFIDWDHSLAMAIGWSLLWGAFFLKDRKVALVAAIAAFSHFVVDWPMHNADLALYPHSSAHIGLGLWGSMGVWSWGLELAFSLVLLGYAFAKGLKEGRAPIWPAVVILLLAVQMSPWLSPMKLVAQLPEPTTHLLHGAGVTLGFILPSFLLVWLYKRLDRRGAARSTSGAEARA